MVRVGGMSYTCAPNEQMGSRISDMRLIATGEPLEADKKYTVGGWASVNENVEGPAIYDLMEKHITEKKVVKMPDQSTVTVKM